MIRNVLTRIAHRLLRPGDVAMLDDPIAYVSAAYLVLLRRPIDPSGLALWQDVVANGRFSQQSVIDGILASPEYQTSFGIRVLDIIHHARQEWVKTLGGFATMLDIGGSSRNLPEGALIELGYPHRPQQLHIMDLPEDQQYWGRPKYSQERAHTFDWGVVSYHHGRAESIDQVPDLQDLRFDCVFLGQAIEHIYKESLPSTLGWIRTHLNPGGRLIFDTPNRLLTKVQCPNSFIDPDHKYEYSPAEMIEVLEQSGFRVSSVTGMVHLPQMAGSGQYDPHEFVNARELHADADRCYLFAMEARPVAECPVVSGGRDEQVPNNSDMLNSRACTQEQVESPVFKEWATRLGDRPRLLHRKLWEWCFISQVFEERGLLVVGAKGLGFAVGKEPLPSLFASRGCSILATDLSAEDAVKEGWVAGNQHASDSAQLNDRGLCAPEVLARNVRFRAVDMKSIPFDLRDFDFLWSSCAMEHLGTWISVPSSL
jgi:hypothetical protein